MFKSSVTKDFFGAGLGAKHIESEELRLYLSKVCYLTSKEPFLNLVVKEFLEPNFGLKLKDLCNEMNYIKSDIRDILCELEKRANMKHE